MRIPSGQSYTDTRTFSILWLAYCHHIFIEFAINMNTMLIIKSSTLLNIITSRGFYSHNYRPPNTCLYVFYALVLRSSWGIYSVPFVHPSVLSYFRLSIIPVARICLEHVSKAAHASFMKLHTLIK